MKKNKSPTSKYQQSAASRPAKTHAAETSKDQRKELKFHGSAACQMLWRQRPTDIARVYVDESRVNELRPLLKWAAAQHIAYHIVEDDDLQRLTESSHHQGICLIAKEHTTSSIMQVKSWLKSNSKPQLLVYLDGVENPHNLGAIVRSCAHFNVPFILGESGSLPKLSPSACRVAEGGAEFVKLVPIKNVLQQLKELQELGCQLLATTMSGESVYQHQFKSHSVLIMGAEVTGISKVLLASADKKLTIPGSNQVESLNVSVAFSIMAGEFFRQMSLES